MPRQPRRAKREPSSVKSVSSLPSCIGPEDFDLILQKLKLLEYGLYGLQQSGRFAALDLEDLGPFYRLAEEVGSDVLALQQRLVCKSDGAESKRSPRRP